MNREIKNYNIGLLGHVDSGKTSLSKVLSKIASTNSFDKNPQSKERGITLDLGFSALNLDDESKGSFLFTFVDCPGHQSLIKTVIGGSQIIDLMILVVDIQKGFEFQTKEHMIIAEITNKPMIIALNKIDIIEETQRERVISKSVKKIQKTLEATVFKDSKIVPVSAIDSTNMEELKKVMLTEVLSMKLSRNINSQFIFAFDHCFAIKGSGTVLSGTVLQGLCNVNELIEFPSLKIKRQIKTIQMFKKSIPSASAGDRIGICVSNFNAKLLERGLICQNGCIQEAMIVVIKINKIRYFKRDIKTKAKFHCSVGHRSVMGSVLLFSSQTNSEFSFNNCYKYEESLQADHENPENFYAAIEFENPVHIYDEQLIIGSKLDDIEGTNMCRLAFHGKIFIQHSSEDKNYKQSFLPNLKVFKPKSREGVIQRIISPSEIIVNLFKKETDRTKFIGMECLLSTGEIGRITGTFGQSAKVRVTIAKSLQPKTVELFNQNKNDIKIILSFKKFMFDKQNRMVQ